MEIKQHTTKVFEEDCTVELMHFNEEDKQKWKELFDKWKELKLGMREYQTREPNFPEGLSEVGFCLYSGSKRFISLTGNANSSFDTFNLETGKAEQIKACSVEFDLTSFGPKSKWDDLYFLDFYSDDKLDGTFDVYKIPTGLIYSMQVNKKETFAQQQAQGRRPRFSIKKALIQQLGIQPIAKDVQVW